MCVIEPEIWKPARRSKPSRRAKHEVLWVDDDPNLTAAYARRLLRRSFHVTAAGDGMQGYWMTLMNPPDVIVTDLKMPRWQGQDLLECLGRNSVTRGIPIVVLSGYADEARGAWLAGMNVAAVLQKPVDFPVLEAVLRRCVA
ncbi:MAG: response regulator [Planctomycetales bacterium]|nr:response regulator [Planctomycetales bacterium]